MVEFECKCTGCSLSGDGVCLYVKGVSRINILNCPNPDVWEDHKKKKTLNKKKENMT